VWPHHEVTPEMERKADAVLEMLEVGHLADRNLIEMSSGEARKMVIGRALVHDPKALVFDEPSNSLDFHAAHELRTTLRKLARQGISIILVTHDLGDVIPEITRTVLIKSGRIFGDGPKSEMLTSENLSELFGLQARITQENGSFHLW
jgi:iron complex transport system ATP-binding protein